MERDVVTHLFFGEDVAQDATSLANIDAGELVWIDKGGNLLNAAALANLGDNEIFYLVEGKRGNNVSHQISPALTKAGITAHRGKSYAAAVQQVSYIGDNGSSGDINASNSTEYSLSISFGWDKDIYSKRRDVKHYNYTSDASATSTEIATAFVNLMNADADFAAQAVAAVETGGGNAGIKITGVAQSLNTYNNTDLVHFKIALDEGFDATTGVDEFGYLYVNSAAPTTTGATSIAPVPGVGAYLDLDAMERNVDGFSTGVTNLRKFPIQGRDKRVSATGTYDMYVLDFESTHESGEVGIGTTRTTKAQIIIANNITTTSNGTTTALEAELFAITGVAVNL